MESDVITLQEIFAFKIDKVTADRVVVGKLEATGLRPTFLYKFEKRGVSMPNDLFAKQGAEQLPEMVARASALQ
jgi:pilus assembly protein CpaF